MHINKHIEEIMSEHDRLRVLAELIRSERINNQMDLKNHLAERDLKPLNLAYPEI